jgi:methionyl-tRNA formyltransferase
MVADRRVYFINAKVEPYSGSAVPGELIRLGRYSATLATGQDALTVHWIRPDGEDKLSLAGFCAKLGLKVGSIL